MKCASIIFTLIVMITNLDVLSQKDDSYPGLTVDNLPGFKRGIYRTFLEFKFNNPSDTSECLLENNELWKIDSLGQKSKVKKHRGGLFSKNGTTLKESLSASGKLWNFWGYSDGKNIFVLNRYTGDHLAWIPSTPPLSDHFCIVDFFGNSYSVFNDKHVISGKPRQFAINMHTGTVFRLTSQSLRSILQLRSPELYRKFKNDSERGSRLIEYIKALD
jgi:hypothetical protein